MCFSYSDRKRTTLPQMGQVSGLLARRGARGAVADMSTPTNPPPELLGLVEVIFITGLALNPTRPMFPAAKLVSAGYCWTPIYWGLISTGDVMGTRGSPSLGPPLTVGSALICGGELDDSSRSCSRGDTCNDNSWCHWSQGRQAVFLINPKSHIQLSSTASWTTCSSSNDCNTSYQNYIPFT